MHEIRPERARDAKLEPGSWEILSLERWEANGVLPSLRIDDRLKARGHSVTLLSHCSYRSMAAQAGLDFAALDALWEHGWFIQDGPLLDTPPGFTQFIRRIHCPESPGNTN
jgi:hypothetical protein